MALVGYPHSYRASDRNAQLQTQLLLKCTSKLYFLNLNTVAARFQSPMGAAVRSSFGLANLAFLR